MDTKICLDKYSLIVEYIGLQVVSEKGFCWTSLNSTATSKIILFFLRFVALAEHREYVSKKMCVCVSVCPQME